MRRALHLLLSVLLASCASRPAPRPVAQGPALWVVQSRDATIYLFGTMHLLIVDVAWLTPAVRTALAQSQDLWVETDIGDRAAVQKAMERAYDPAYTLADHITPSEWALARDFVQTCGIPADKFAHMRPWAVNVTLNACGVHGIAAAADKFHDRGKKRTPGFNMPDAYLVQLATLSGLHVHGFETAAQQIAALADPPESVQLAMLQAMLKAAGKGQAMSTEAKRTAASASVKLLLDMERNWFTGNIDGTTQQIETAEQKGAPEVTASIFTLRNERFADNIAQMLGRPTHAFVAIGVGHFVGPGNVLALLRTLGYTIERVE